MANIQVNSITYSLLDPLTSSSENNNIFPLRIPYLQYGIFPYGSTEKQKLYHYQDFHLN